MDRKKTISKMIYPIVAYGDPVLRKRSAEIPKDYLGLPGIIDNMFETMYHALGVGLAAPQIGFSIRLFVVDASPFKDDDGNAAGFKKVFINAEIISDEGAKWKFNEGCLSIPGIREDIERKSTITIRYFDEHFKEHIEVFDGMPARIIQHEYDHIEGILFTDRLTPLKKRLLKGRLTGISKGVVDVSYRMRFSKR